MLYSYTILYVPDVEKTILFYEKAFGFERKFLTPEKDYAELATGSTTLAFASTELGKSNVKKGFIESSVDNRPFGIELAFITKTLEEDYQKAVDNGAEIEEPIVLKSWGQKVGYLRDNNGFLIEMAEPIHS